MGPRQGTELGCHTWEGSLELRAWGGRAQPPGRPAIELLEEALLLLGLRQFSCLHYFFL